MVSSLPSPESTGPSQNIHRSSCSGSVISASTSRLSKFLCPSNNRDIVLAENQKHPINRFASQGFCAHWFWSEFLYHPRGNFFVDWRMQEAELCVARVLQGMFALCRSTNEGKRAWRRRARQSHDSDGDAIVITRGNHGVNGELILIPTDLAWCQITVHK